MSRQASQARRRRGESGGGWDQGNGEKDMVWLLSTAEAGEEAERGPESLIWRNPSGAPGEEAVSRRASRDYRGIMGF